jgi:Trp operon repressor
MFSEIIESLIKSGMTEKEIGVAVNASQPTINRIRNGLQSPYYELGSSLIALNDSRKEKAA